MLFIGSHAPGKGFSAPLALPAVAVAVGYKLRKDPDYRPGINF